MNTEPQIAVEPVTDEDVAACINYGSRAQIRAILLKDRRRVAERQAPEIERLRAEVAQADADYNDAVTLAQMNLDLLKAAEAEVAALKAACGQKDQAIRRIFTPGNLSPETRAFVEAALSDHAGKGWIDATGAVEATVQHIGANQGVPECFHISVTVPAEWAGSPVKIVRKP